MPRSETSPWNLGGLTYKQLAKRVGGEITKDDVFGRSAELSYYFLLALFPLLFFLVSILGFVLGGDPAAQRHIMDYFGRVLPGQASQLVSQTISQIMHASSGTKLVLGLLGALWTASSGMSAIMDALNITYDVKEGRPYWKRRLVAGLLTIAAACLVVAAFVLITYGPKIANTVLGHVGLAGVFAMVWKIVQWPVAIFFVMIAFALTYYAGPDVKQRKWYWISPGATLGILLWLVASFGFRVYLHFFNSYSRTYGALGAVIILMLWFYITGASILIGSEVNSEVEHAASQRGEPEAKAPGQKAA
jgi:membrane protein